MEEGPRAVQPKRKTNGAGSKVISIMFGLGFIYVVCRRDLQLDYTALVLLVLLGKGQVLQIVYILVFLTVFI